MKGLTIQKMVEMERMFGEQLPGNQNKQLHLKRLMLNMATFAAQSLSPAWVCYVLGATEPIMIRSKIASVINDDIKMIEDGRPGSAVGISVLINIMRTAMMLTEAGVGTNHPTFLTQLLLNLDSFTINVLTDTEDTNAFFTDINNRLRELALRRDLPAPEPAQMAFDLSGLAAEVPPAGTLLSSFLCHNLARKQFFSFSPMLTVPWASGLYRCQPGC